MSQCQVCTAPTDGFICAHHGARLEKVLAEMPALIDDLEITATKQDRINPGGKRGKGDEAPLPFNWSAGDQLWAVANTLGTWARHMFESRHPDGTPFPLGEPAQFAVDVRVVVRRNRWFISRETRLVRQARPAGPTEVARWLLGQVQSIRMDEAGGRLYDEVTYAHDQAQRIIDRPEPEIYAGRCDAADVRVIVEGGALMTTIGVCGSDLYARLVDKAVKCPTCGAEYDLALRKKDLLARVDDEWARPHIIANALTSLDEPVTPETLRKWIERKYIPQVGIDDDGKPLYRVGDVVARVALMRERRDERSAS